MEAASLSSRLRWWYLRRVAKAETSAIAPSAFLVLPLFLGCSSFALGQTLSIRLSKGQYAVGDNVEAEIRSRGKVTVESDLSRTSFSVSVDYSRKVDLGRIREPGFYLVRVISGSQRDAVAFVALPDQGHKNVTVVPLSFQSKQRSRLAQDSDLFVTFVKQLDAARLKTALANAFGDWSAKHANQISKTVVVGGLCVGGVPVACGEGARESIQLGASLIASVLQQAARDLHEEGKLTADQLRRLGKILTSGGALIATLDVGDAWERLFVAIEAFIELTAESNGIKTVIKYSTDEAGKIRFLIKLGK